MAGGPIALSEPSRKGAVAYNGGITLFVIFACTVAASGGFLFGYDNGVTGGVTASVPFQQKFFPELLEAKEESAYCKYDNHIFQLFTSSLFLAGMVASIPAAMTTRNLGRKVSMMVAATFYLGGVVLVTAAVHVGMLVAGRVLLGLGVGFANQAVPMYNSEMAPAQFRGALNILFQLACTVGILVAQLINYGTKHINPWGWRLSLGLAIVPALVLFLGGLFLPDTPNSLIERGKFEEGRRVLQRIRGVQDVDAEFEDIRHGAQLVQEKEQKWTAIFARRYRPQLVLCIAMPLFQQFTGINAIIFYAPQLFKSLGSDESGALLSTLIIGAVNVGATFVAIFAVDRWGRKPLLLQGGIQMIAAEVAIGSILALKFTTGALSSSWSLVVIVLICVHVSSFAWSWGPLGWLIPAEVCPLEVRSTGQSINVAVNFLFTFIIGQFFLTMLCSMQWGIFLFFAAFVATMTLFAALFIPETKDCPIEMTVMKLDEHWFWKRYTAVPIAPYSAVQLGETAAAGKDQAEV